MITGIHSITTENACMIVEKITGSRVILSIPHDGLPTNSLSGLFEIRKTGYRGRDLYVWPLAKDILLKTGASAVRGLMPRAFVDYNRSWPKPVNYYPLTQKEVHTALEDSRLEEPYTYYHSTIDGLVGKSIKKYGKEKVILFDLHGFKRQPPYAPEGGYDLILGTGNRIAIPYGEVDREFTEFMRKREYTVFLPESLTVGREEDYYSADFITRHHSEKHGINVIQIEIAPRFRTRDGLEAGQKLAIDFAEFLNTQFPN